MPEMALVTIPVDFLTQRVSKLLHSTEGEKNKAGLLVMSLQKRQVVHSRAVMSRFLAIL